MRDTATLLEDAVERYYFVSTRSAYAAYDRVPMTADTPTHTIEGAGADPEAESFPYGLAKAEAERRLLSIIGPERAGIFRPGLIIGPGDETERFTYWPVRIDRGGEILAPGDGTDPVQIIDVRDMVEWMVRMAEVGEAGVYNYVGPRVPRPIGEMVAGIQAVTNREAIFTWVDTEWLLESGVRPYADLPVWRPSDQGPGFARFDLSEEVAKGLTFRSLAETTADTLQYYYGRSGGGTASSERGCLSPRKPICSDAGMRDRAPRGAGMPGWGSSAPIHGNGLSGQQNRIEEDEAGRLRGGHVTEGTISQDISVAIVRKWDYTSLADFDDPDDYRPNSELAMVIDPARPDGASAGNMTVFYERIGPADKIPLHQHTVEEVFFLDSGTIEVTLSERRETIEPGAMVFIPAGVAHGFRNVLNVDRDVLGEGGKGEDRRPLDPFFDTRLVGIGRYVDLGTDVTEDCVGLVDLLEAEQNPGIETRLHPSLQRLNIDSVGERVDGGTQR